MGEEPAEQLLLQKDSRVTSTVSSGLQSSRKAILRQYFTAIIINLLMLDIGQTWSWTSSAQGALMSPDSPVGSPFTFQEFVRIQISLSSGYLVGCCIWANIADLIGRKRSVLLCGLIQLTSWIVLATATSKLAIFLPTFIQGLSGSGAFIVVPLYISEAIGKNIRSTAASLQGPTYVFGIFFSYIIGSILSFRYFLFASSSVSALFITLFSLFPESPSYLHVKRNLAGAEKSLLWLEAGNSALVKEQLRALSQTTFNDKKVSFSSLIRSKKNRSGLLIVLGVNLFIIGCGADFIIPLAGGIFDQAGFDTNDSLPVLVLGATKFVFSSLAPLAIANFRRKLLIKIAFSMTTISSLIIGLYFTFLLKGYDFKPYRHVMTLCMSLIEGSHAATLGSMISPLAMELVDRPLLSRAFSIQVIWQTLCTISNFEVIAWIISLFGLSSAFFIFSTASILGVIFTLFVVPETKGKSSTEF